MKEEHLKNKIDWDGHAFTVVKTFRERPAHWNNDGEMYEYMGEVIKLNESSFLDFESKRRLPGGSWFWRTSDFDVEKTFEKNGIFFSENLFVVE
jgi:hypothetical protein